MDRRRLPAHLRGGDPGGGLARRPLRHPAGVHQRADRLRGHLARLRAVADARSTDHLPRAAGRGRGPGHPGRGGDALPGVLDGGSGKGGDRRAQRGGDRPGDRADARRDPGRRGVVALDLPDQRTDRRGRDRAVVPLARGDEARHARPLRSRRVRTVRFVGGDPAVHAVDRTGEGVVLRLHPHPRLHRHRLPRSR